MAIPQVQTPLPLYTSPFHCCPTTGRGQCHACSCLMAFRLHTGRSSRQKKPLNTSWKGWDDGKTVQIQPAHETPCARDIIIPRKTCCHELHCSFVEESSSQVEPKIPSLHKTSIIKNCCINLSINSAFPRLFIQNANPNKFF